MRGRLAATGGVTPTKNHPIRLQKLKSGAWRTVESVRDGKGGQIVLRYRGPKAGKFRLHWSGVAEVQGAVSAAFRLRR